MPRSYRSYPPISDSRLGNPQPDPTATPPTTTDNRPRVGAPTSRPDRTDPDYRALATACARAAWSRTSTRSGGAQVTGFGAARHACEQARIDAPWSDRRPSRLPPAPDYAERDGLQGAALCPAGGGIAATDRCVDFLHRVGADDDSLQLSGDGFIAAVMQRVDGIVEPAAISWLRSASEAGTGMTSWPTSLMLSSAADRRRRYGRRPSTSRSWPASSKATHSPRGPHRCQDR